MDHMTASPQIDFAYPWWLSYGHFTLLACATAASLLVWRCRWPRWILITLGALALWAAAATVVVHHSLGFHRPAELPTQSFLREGNGRVLDLGAGTGRSSLMVLQSRPAVTLVALDQFAKSYESHFGRRQDPQQLLHRNLAAAGVESRATIVQGDMRRLPFADQGFDALVSAYAFDHLGSRGAEQALLEARRVLKPGGEFLLILVANDARAKFAFGPLLSHGGLRGPQWWKRQLEQAGFRIEEQGAAPLTLYFLLRRP
jgi:ubiquinone/menaquinone biosynthesis C-methylase UbiE